MYRKREGFHLVHYSNKERSYTENEKHKMLVFGNKITMKNHQISMICTTVVRQSRYHFVTIPCLPYQLIINLLYAMLPDSIDVNILCLEINKCVCVCVCVCVCDLQTHHVCLHVLRQSWFCWLGFGPFWTDFLNPTFRTQKLKVIRFQTTYFQY